jgi:hypothetical protein
MKKRRRMKCSVCGDNAGRWEQHWNRDNGYGVCVDCVKWVRSKLVGETAEVEIADLYGTEGVNWGSTES